MAFRRYYSRQSEFESLDPALQLRIKRTLKIAGVWGSLVLVSGVLFFLSKPYLYKKRLERMKQPGYKPSVTLRYTPPHFNEDEDAEAKERSNEK